MYSNYGRFRKRVSSERKFQHSLTSFFLQPVSGSLLLPQFPLSALPLVDLYLRHSQAHLILLYCVHCHYLMSSIPLWIWIWISGSIFKSPSYAKKLIQFLNSRLTYVNQCNKCHQNTFEVQQYLSKIPVSSVAVFQHARTRASDLVPHNFLYTHHQYTCRPNLLHCMGAFLFLLLQVLHHTK